MMYWDYITEALFMTRGQVLHMMHSKSLPLINHINTNELVSGLRKKSSIIQNYIQFFRKRHFLRRYFDA